MKNDTIFHESRFLSYHGDRFKDRSMMIKDDYWFTAAEVININGSKILHSHPGASFGGIVLPYNSTLKKVDEVVNNIIYYAEKNKFDEIFMRLPPYIYHKHPCDELDYSLVHNEFKLVNSELSLAIPVDLDLEEWKSSVLRSDTRRSMKKQKGVTIAWSDDYYSFWKILSDNLETRYDVQPTHTINEILMIKDLYPYNVWLISCYYNTKMIAGVVLIVAGSTCFEVFYIAQDYEYQKYRPVNLLFEEVYRWAYMNDFKYINLGISTENQGRDVNWGLFRFKEGFGSNSVLRKSYSLFL